MPRLASRDLSERSLPARVVLSSLERVRNGLRRRLERPGFRAAIDRKLINPWSSLRHRLAAPRLDALQERIVGDLEARGIATTTFDALVGDAALWERLLQASADLEASDRGPGKKPHIIPLRDGPWLDADHVLFSLGLSDRLLGTANAYLGLWSKLLSLDLWHVQTQDAQARQTSQRWHRDPEDRRMLKVFLYLSDVDEGAGPFDYIPNSRSGERYAQLWPLARAEQGEGYYPPDGLIESAVPAADRMRCVGPAGTLIFCDTSGFHRGGHATESPRRSAFWEYVSPASPTERRMRPRGEPAYPSPAARYALSDRRLADLLLR